MTPEQLEETWKLRNNMSGDSAGIYGSIHKKMLKRTQNNQQLFEVFP